MPKRSKLIPGVTKPANCHPDKPAFSKGLCSKCYYIARYRKRRQAENADIPVDKAYIGKKYGMAPQEYEALVTLQANRCGICGGAPKKRRLNIDHNHRTGKVRGLLCYRCNYALGYWHDWPELATRLHDYLTNPPMEKIRGQVAKHTPAHTNISEYVRALSSEKDD